MKNLDFTEQISAAKKRIHSYIRETPLEFSNYMSQLTAANVFLKLENYQQTGSFKVRGAMNKLLSLTPSQQQKGIVAASSGNHGIAVAYGLNKLNLNGIIFVPNNASVAKVTAIKNFGVNVQHYSDDCLLTENYARQYAAEHNMTYIAPYNDIEVIFGQGTSGLELSQQLNSIDAVFIAVGGGGLISGIAGFLKSVSPQTKIIGCLPANSPVMSESIKAGHILEMETKPTLSDATAGGMEADSITFNLCQKYVDDYITVSEEEIKNALLLILEKHRMLIEGASGVALASFLKTQQQYHNKNIVIVLSGGNSSLSTLQKIICLVE